MLPLKNATQPSKAWLVPLPEPRPPRFTDSGAASSPRFALLRYFPSHKTGPEAKTEIASVRPRLQADGRPRYGSDAIPGISVGSTSEEISDQSQDLDEETLIRGQFLLTLSLQSISARINSRKPVYKLDWKIAIFPLIQDPLPQPKS
ncbi:hypothetical protein AOLI_G00281990 [Acnodon oligacanthus]